jgi:hypothetical protein
VLTKLVAVPATAATWVKFVQPTPRQRSILTSVWLVDPLVQVSPIELRVSAVAFRPDGAGGRRGLTTMEPVVVLEVPSLSVTLRDAV